MSLDCQDRYFSNLRTKKLFLERGMLTDGVAERIPRFYNRLRAIHWDCFVAPPCQANEQCVLDFYGNLNKVNFDDPVINIRGKMVRFGAQEINVVYNLSNHPTEPMANKVVCGNGCWLVDTLCGEGAKMPWLGKKMGITNHEFNAEARAWQHILVRRVYPSSNTSTCTYARALIIACIMDGMEVNVGNHMIRELKEYVHRGGSILMLSPLITKFCRIAGVDKDPDDNIVNPNPSFDLCRIKGEGGAIPRKKRKVRVSTSRGSPLYPEGPFGEISTQIKDVYDAVTQNPIRSTSVRPSKLAGDKWKKFFDDQKA
ncbi:uncharacterized protein LOC132609159 [Lycium barbarum]|uniref:uncharacterized protein LOC132609159 n=1 Tax=Lycium barbarum TaxID=112863 RepID=UPI00293E0086|nr:uncharacterized protein LOC132609159 [Lycium barbarum]XP_060179006.1 uncharacterized protein LOC132609159 [Lycium barbarum]